MSGSKLFLLALTVSLLLSLCSCGPFGLLPILGGAAAGRGGDDDDEKEIPLSAPGKVTSPSPGDAALGESVIVTLSWVPAAGADTYDVYLGTDSALLDSADTGSAEFKGNHAGLSYDPGTLSYNTTYYWRIDSCNTVGTARGDIWSFTIAPEKVTGPSPADMATAVPVTTNLSWTAATGGAPVYEVYFGTDSTAVDNAGTSSTEYKGNQVSTFFDPSPAGNLNYSTTYYWRIDSCGPTAVTKGDTWQFTTEDAPVVLPDVVTNPDPVSSATDEATDCIFSWDAAGGATSYDVYFGTSAISVANATTASAEFMGNQTAMTYDPGALTYSTDYYWRIDSVNAVGTTRGDLWSFTTAPPPPVADFTADVTSGDAPLSVSFSDASTGSISAWSWDFGDGGTSTAQDPSHTYNSEGAYNVILTVTGLGGSDSQTRVDYITVTTSGVAPVADFTSDTVTGDAPLTVSFSDASTGSVTAWSWDFGDSGTSTAPSPTHTYTTTGTYSVTLTVTGPDGTDGETKTDYITVTFAALTTIYVATTGNDITGDGSMGSPYLTIQKGLDTVTSGTTVIVLDGTYTGAGNKDLDFAGKDIYLKSAGGPANCIIDCQNSGRGFYFHAGETNAAIVEGFTITGGNVSGGVSGAGIYCDNASPTITNCEITGNTSDYYGGGIYCENDADLMITNCTIVNNTGVYGGGISCYYSSPTITNCTIAGNSAGEGGGILCQGNGNPTLNNTILRANTASSNGNEISTMTALTVTLNYCDYANGVGDVEGSGTVTPTACITLDPLFVDAGAQDYRLQNISPCVDAGDNSYVTWGEDLDGNQRIVDGNSDTIDTVDIGAYERVSALPAPVADFSADTTSGVAPLLVSFTDLSTGNVTSWSWDFGDGGTSTEPSPLHTYNSTGVHIVTLTVTGPGGSDQEVKTDYITVSAVGVTAGFFANTTTGPAPLTVNFTDTSTGTVTSWSWDFGDGGTSTIANPQHTYNSVGTYTVTLTATGPGGTDGETKTGYITVSDPPPVADFTADVTSGTVALTVNFTDLSTGLPTVWSWAFGDGGTSSSQDPTHIYNSPGTYTVILAVVGPGGSDSITRTNYITVTPPAPVANFAADTTSGPVPLAVSFTDASTGTVTSWLWDFGDFGTSTEQDPSHTYTIPGTYTVILNVTGPGGSDGETKTDYITVYPPVQITTSSLPDGFEGSPYSTMMTATDGTTPYTWSAAGLPTGLSINTSTGQITGTPAAGTSGASPYSVSISVTDSSSPVQNDTGGFSLTIILPGGPPGADFSASPRSGIISCNVSFTDLSTGAVTSWEWDFDGDGTTDSNTQNPPHTYSTGGWYTVSLTAYGPGGSDTCTKDRYIFVYDDIWYVDAAGGSDANGGTSWADAFATIQRGINSASDYHQVLVADGTYTGPGNKDLMFNGKKIHLTTYDRYSTNSWIIDCELAGRGVFFWTGDTRDTVMDGFTIQNGNMINTNGGGIACVGGASPTIVNCTIKNCRAEYISIATKGGGITCETGSDPYVKNCTFENNCGDWGGGGAYCYNADATFENCIFWGNWSSDSVGGAIYADTGSSVTVTNCALYNNSGSNGGGIQAYQATITVTDCVITNNTATFSAGIKLVETTGTVTNCLIADNFAILDGGGISVFNCSPTITNCTIAGNSTGMSGAGVFCGTSAQPALNNCIIWGNTASTEGNEIYVEAGTTVTLKYCDFANNKLNPNNIRGAGTISPDPNCINSDPLFVDAFDGDFRLNPGSPCFDAGSDSYVTWDKDVNGNPRIMGRSVDIGAYELNVIRVPVDYATIQAAIDAAAAWDVVLVADGTYTGAGNKDLDFNGKTIALRSENGPASCIIDCQNAGRGFYFHTGETNNAVVEGFTIENGNTVGGGGAIYCNASSPSISSCRILRNSATNQSGGGIRCVDSNPTITNCLIAENSTNWDGGGIHCERSSPVITNCTITGNSVSPGYGGGIYCYDTCSPTLNNTILWDNDDAQTGDEIYINNGCTITMNYCDYANAPGDIGGPGTVTPASCITLDPLFVDSSGSDYQLKCGSPCFNAGSNSFVTWENDLNGNPRIMGVNVDIGAYELNVLRVTSQYPTIQAAIDAAATWDVVLVADSTYTGVGNKDLDFFGKTIALRSEYGPASCIIDCQNAGRGLYFHTGETKDAVVDGFTIQNGSVTGVYPADCGGGICCDASSPTITNCTIVGNRSGTDGEGAGIYCVNSSSLITNCRITSNLSGDSGGGIGCRTSSLTIANCAILDNTSGGGSDNQGGGGGIIASVSDLTIVNCTIAGNISNTVNAYGGGILYSDSSSVITNCTVAGNWAADTGGGVSCWDLSNVTMNNCILWDNIGSSGGNQIYTNDAGSNVVLNYCDYANGAGDIEGSGTVTPDANCITLDPLFVNATAQDYRLQGASPCIDAGENSYTTGLRRDLDGYPRIFDGDGDSVKTVDIGAYEFNGGLFISEYVEGSSFDKAIEICNGSLSDIDLSTCELRLYMNGNSIPDYVIPVNPVMLAPGEVYVIGHTSFSIPALCDQLSGSLLFNGNDVVELVLSGVTLDVIGQIGFDPGIEWGVGDASTADNTIRRKSGIIKGDPDGSDAFDPSTEWDGFPIDTLGGLGSHP